MGRCHEFGILTASNGCEHPMRVSSSDTCTCPGCGAVCRGKFDGCAEIWAQGPREVPFVPRLTSTKATDRGPMAAPAGAVPNGHSAAATASGASERGSWDAFSPNPVASTGQEPAASGQPAAAGRVEPSLESLQAAVERQAAATQAILDAFRRLATKVARLEEDLARPLQPTPAPNGVGAAAEAAGVVAPPPGS